MSKNNLFHASLILLFLIGISMYSCTKTIDDTDLLNIKWIFTEGEHEGFVFESIEEIYIEFTSEEASGFGGCNMFWHQYDRTGNELDVTGLTYTEKACGNGITEIENKFFDLLAKAESLKLKGEKLTIFCENGQLEFQRED